MLRSLPIYSQVPELWRWRWALRNQLSGVEFWVNRSSTGRSRM